MYLITISNSNDDKLHFFFVSKTISSNFSIPEIPTDLHILLFLTFSFITSFFDSNLLVIVLYCKLNFDKSEFISRPINNVPRMANYL